MFKSHTALEHLSLETEMPEGIGLVYECFPLLVDRFRRLNSDREAKYTLMMK